MCPHDTILDITQRSDTDRRGTCERCGQQFTRPRSDDQAEWQPENQAQEETR